MIKNLIIIFLVYMIGSLLIAKPDNIEILKSALFTTKEFIGEGVDYLENNFKEADTEKSSTENSIGIFTEKKTFKEDSFLVANRRQFKVSNAMGAQNPKNYLA